MANRRGVLITLLSFMGVSLIAQQSTTQPFAPGYVDPVPVLEAARRAIGVDNLRCVTFSGTGYAGMVGQQRLNDRNVDWPRGEPLANYSRTMNWDAGTMKEEFERKSGLNPASWKHGLGWVGGTPRQKNPRQIFVVNAATAGTTMARVPVRFHRRRRTRSDRSWTCGSIRTASSRRR